MSESSEALLPYNYAAKHRVIASFDQEQLVISTPNKLHPLVISELTRHFGPHYVFKQISNETFQSALLKQYSQSGKDKEHSANALDQQGDHLDDLLDELGTTIDLLDDQDDAPIVRLINAIINDGIEKEASDIHLESNQDKVTIRFRVDGILDTGIAPPRTLARRLVSRIKVMAKMDIAEKRIPQDGKIRITRGSSPIDLRVSTLPTRYGERVVLRILDNNSSSLSLAELGFSDHHLEQLQRMISRPHGILLTTGPTGSGKTTTLYAALAHLNNGRRNILTIEDPVEYELSGISQTQVNVKAGMTFATGLRSVLRQDPDVVMVGEIRDKETAEIAIQASLTGHLVLSTLHTNTAAGAITRLVDMGIPPYLLSSSLSGVIAQRLVRRLCNHCPTDSEVPRELAKLLALENPIIKAPQGCPACQHLGYKGRIALFEFLPVSKEISNMIHNGASEKDIQACSGENNIIDDCRRLLASGQTSLEEILSVVAL